jgi:hypothetical protein
MRLCVGASAYHLPPYDAYAGMACGGGRSSFNCRDEYPRILAFPRRAPTTIMNEATIRGRDAETGTPHACSFALVFFYLM